jgi:phosphoribosylformylglycinamidine synthase
MDLCPQLGVSIPVGKDSLSMKTAWSENGNRKEVTAPLSLIISAFAPVADVRGALTPQMRTDDGDTALLLVDLGAGLCRMGGSALAQAHGPDREYRPDGCGAAEGILRNGKASIGREKYRPTTIARRWLFATVCEMALAGRVKLRRTRHDVPGDKPAIEPYSMKNSVPSPDLSR